MVQNDTSKESDTSIQTMFPSLISIPAILNRHSCDRCYFA